MAASAASRAWQTPEGEHMSDASFLKQSLAKAQERLAPRIARGEISGLVAMAGRGDKGQMIALGHADPRSIFRIASMTKPVAAAAAMMLIEDGKLKLEDPVDKFIPELANRRVLKRLDAPLGDTEPAQRRFTVEDLLTFKWGMGLILGSPDRYPILKHIQEQKIFGFGPPDPLAPDPPDLWVRKLATLPLMSQPGTHWMYNTGSCLLGVLIARASGITLANFLRERIFQPLRMPDTDFSVDVSNADRLLDAYVPSPSGLKVSDPAKTSAWSKPPIFEDAAAGLVSTASDYLAFSQFILRRGGSLHGARLLDVNSVDAMLQDRLTSEQRAEGAAILGEGRGWGFGLSVVSDGNAAHLPMGTVGWNGGLGTSWLGDPRSNTTAILLTQTAFTSPTSLGSHQDLWHSVFD